MNRFFCFLIIIILVFIPSETFAAQELYVEKNAEENEILLPDDAQIPERDINNDGVIDEKDSTESLFKKILVKQAAVEKTDYANYLLKDVLTVDFDRGPVDKIQFYGKYRGNLAFNFTESDYSSEYDITSIDAGIMGKLNPEYKTDFKFQLKFTPAKDKTFFQQLISDAYIVNRAIPNHEIMFGNLRNQVGVEGGMSSTFKPFILRSQIARTFGNTRAFGVKVNGIRWLITVLP